MDYPGKPFGHQGNPFFLIELKAENDMIRNNQVDHIPVTIIGLSSMSFTMRGGLPLMFLLLMLGAVQADAQQANKPKLLQRDTLFISSDSVYNSTTGGEFTPSKGFDLFKSKYASLNISLYGLARYINQLPGEQTYTDNLGNVRIADPRQDVQWHRTFAWLSGHFLTPRLRYTISLWGLASTQQTLIFGNLQYYLTKSFRFGVGIGPNYGVRSLQF